MEPTLPTVVITGATSGIGRSLAVQLAGRGRRVIALVREPKRLPVAPAGGRIEGIRVDLSRPDEVVAAARRVADGAGAEAGQAGGAGPPAVLIHNAAVVPRRRTTTPEGFELQLMVNYLAPVLLTAHLLPVLQGGRIITLSSHLHAHPAAELDARDPLDLDTAPYDWSGMPGWAAYCRTKLMDLLFAFRLARVVPRERCVSNACHPGAAATRLSRELPLGTRLASALFFRRPRAGAATPLYLAEAPEAGSVTGLYFVNRRPAETSPAARDEGLQDALHEKTTGLLARWLPAG